MIDKKYCSPNAKLKNSTCLSKNSLIELIKCWNKNKANKNKILFNPNNSTIELFNKLNDVLKNICGANNYWFWTDIIKLKTNDYDSIKKIDIIDEKELRPSQPDDWIENPVEWLSNFDIINVMKQYEDIKSLNYKFLGVFPIDFSLKSNNKCTYGNDCNIDIRDLIKKKIKYIGFITNLDKHNEPGSHWTSTFININPKSNSYGAYYYDSTSKTIPNYIVLFLDDIKKQLKDIYKNKTFDYYYNHIRHQRSNTECGVFSIVYQVLCVKLLKKNKDTPIDDVFNNDEMTDKVMYKVRNTIFRPNIKSII